MGIRSIFILTQPREDFLAVQAQQALEAKLMAEHRRGEHPYGSMRRECPLCKAQR